MVTVLPGDAGKRAKVMEQRRAILLTILQCTPPESTSLQAILKFGFASHVKRWIDECLQGTVGT